MSVRKIKSLIAKLARLKSEIETEKKSVRPDWLRLRQLKKIRLGVKDHVARLTLKAQSLNHIPDQDANGLHRYKRPQARHAPQPHTITVRG